MVTDDDDDDDDEVNEDFCTLSLKNVLLEGS